MMLPDAAPDGCTYLSTAQAADLFGLTPAAIRRWVRVGYLKPRAKDARGHALYDLQDVTEAEFLAREAAIRTAGTDRRVRRRIAA